MGPGAWSGAKKAIEDAPRNVINATKTRSLPKKEDAGKNEKNMYMMILVLLGVVIAICVSFM